MQTLGLGIAGLAPSAKALEPDQIFQKVAPSVWQVRTLGPTGERMAQGSAVVVASERLVTNCHVITKASTVMVVRENTLHEATLEFPDPERDLCQLRVKGLLAPPVSMADMTQLRVGQRVYAIGSPQGLSLTLSDGLLSALRLDKAERLEAIQTTAPISSGSSGGGLFDDQGRLLGITTYGVVGRQGSVAQNLNFAVPASWLAELPLRGAANMAKLQGASPATAAAAAATATPPSSQNPVPAAPPSSRPATATGSSPRLPQFIATERTPSGRLAPAMLPMPEAIAVKSAPVLAAGYLPGQPVEGQRRLNGLELADLFSKPLTFEARTNFRGYLVMRTDGKEVMSMDSRINSGRGSGYYRVNRDSAELCLDVPRLSYTLLQGCHPVFLIGAARYSLRTTNGDYALDFEL